MAEIINSGTTTVSLDEVDPHPENPREGDINKIAESIESKGFYNRITVQESTGYILAGNHRYWAAELVGMDEIPVEYVDVDDETALDILVGDNRLSDIAENEPSKLADILSHLNTRDKGLEGTGYEQSDLDELLDELDRNGASNGEAPEAEVDRAEELRQEWGTEKGQLWQIGRHRLLCGDSTDSEDVGRLLDGAEPQLLVTSPPYDQQRDYTDASDTSDWTGLMVGAFTAVKLHKEVQVLVNLGLVHSDNEWQPYWREWFDWMRSDGWRRYGWYVWDQGHGLRGDFHGRLAPSFEFVFHFNRVSKKPTKWMECKHAGKDGGGLRKPDGSIEDVSDNTIQPYKIPDSVIRCERQNGGIDGHPAPFSVDLPMYLIRSWDGSVYEPFCGSGSTIVASENCNRVCYAVDVEPAYIAVTLQRLSDMGLEPELIE